MPLRDRRAATYDGLSYASGRRFRVITEGAALNGHTPAPSGARGWQQKLQPGDILTCTGYGPGFGADPGYGVGFTSPAAEAAGAFCCDIWPMAGGSIDYHPPAGFLEPADGVAAGDLVISWDDTEPVTYGGPSEHTLTTLILDLTGKAGKIRKCDPGKAAPASVTIPAKDPRLSVEKRPSAEKPYGAQGNWKLTLPGQQPTWHSTKRDAAAAGLRRVAILDWHAARTPAASQ